LVAISDNWHYMRSLCQQPNDHVLVAGSHSLTISSMVISQEGLLDVRLVDG
jgi:hypothetical protein